MLCPPSLARSAIEASKQPATISETVGGRTYTDGRFMLARRKKYGYFMNLCPSPPPKIIYKYLTYQPRGAASLG